MKERSTERRPGPTVPILAVVVTIVTAAVIAGLALFLPLSVRHAAPFGAEQTIDFRRGLAVTGAEVTPNYDRFDRVDLDLRGYTDPVPGGRYDLILTIRDVESGETLRTVGFSAEADDIAASRSSFSPLATTVRFAPIGASAGRAYYVDVERGPRNAGDVVTLWGVQTSSTLTAAEVLGASLDWYDLGLSPGPTRVVLVLLYTVTLAALSAAAGAVVVAVRPGLQVSQVGPGPGIAARDLPAVSRMTHG